jgi:hypothetical protein
VKRNSCVSCSRLCQFLVSVLAHANSFVGKKPTYLFDSFVQTIIFWEVGFEAAIPARKMFSEESGDDRSFLRGVSMTN